MRPAQLESAVFMERVVILAILLALLAIHFVVVHKVAFLGFYYLPILLAGYFCGKRVSLLLSILAVFLVVLYSMVEPGKMSPDLLIKEQQLAALRPGSLQRPQVVEEIGAEKFKLYFSLAAWGSFLVLCAIASSVLYEQKKKRIEELRQAYVGTLEILTKYLELADRYSVGRSIRVSDLAVGMAKRMDLRVEETENIRIAALLHDLGHKDVSALILEKSAELGREIGTAIKTASVSGQEVLRSVSSVLEDVVPIVNGFHDYFVGGKVKDAPEFVITGAEVIAAARTYDDMVTGTPARRARPPGQALEEIHASAGKQFSPRVVQALEKALEDRKARQERETTT